MSALKKLNPLEMFSGLNLLRIELLALDILEDDAPRRKCQILKISFIKLRMIKIKILGSMTMTWVQLFATTVRRNDTTLVFVPSLKRLHHFLMLLFIFLAD